MILTGSWKSWVYKALSKTIIQLFLLISMILPLNVMAQEEDAVILDDTEETLRELSDNATLFEQQSELDPQTASIYSAVLPGLGQAYNKQYWKIPIIYAGGLAFIQIVKKNNLLYRAFRNALFNEIDLDENTVSPFGERFSVDALRRNTDRFRRDRDFFIIMGLLWYGLNVVEAHISAHLDEFDVNDELSMRVTPTLISVPTSPIGFGLSVTFNLNG